MSKLPNITCLASAEIVASCASWYNSSSLPNFQLCIGDNPEAADHPNDRDKWATLTQLQYDRLTKWAQGSFKPGTRFEGVDTPRDLTRAALKWTTGAPLFPGIEAYWVVKLSSMYHLPVDAKTLGFRFHNSVRAGDLTKGLSLPWQADFYM